MVFEFGRKIETLSTIATVPRGVFARVFRSEDPLVTGNFSAHVYELRHEQSSLRNVDSVIEYPKVVEVVCAASSQWNDVIQ